MATITLAEIRSAVRLRMNSYSTDSRLTDANLLIAINQAIREISFEHDWFWLIATPATITTVAGTATYALPADHFRTKNIVDTSIGQHLEQYSITDIDQIVGQGRPQLYSIEGGNVVLSPTPDGVYTLQHRYLKIETPLSADANTPFIPREYSYGIIQKSSQIAARYIKDSQLAAECAADYNDWLKSVEDNNFRSKEPMRVRVRPGSWV